MRISRTAAFCTHSADQAGLQVLHIMQTEFGRVVRTVTGPGQLDDLLRNKVPIVQLVTGIEGTWPSRYFRVLPSREMTDRVVQERDELFSRHPWLTPHGDILHINPAHLVNDYFVDDGCRKSFEGMKVALLHLCYDPLARFTSETHVPWGKQQRNSESGRLALQDALSN